MAKVKLVCDGCGGKVLKSPKGLPTCISCSGNTCIECGNCDCECTCCDEHQEDECEECENDH